MVKILLLKLMPKNKKFGGFSERKLFKDAKMKTHKGISIVNYLKCQKNINIQEENV